MKKAIILLALSLSLLSCSSDDSTPNPNLDLNYANLAGQWYFKETIKANGTIVPYDNLCPTSPDYVEFFVNAHVNNYIHATDCVYTGHGDNHLNLDVPTKKLWSSGGEIPDSIVIKLTENELQLQYEEELAPGTETKILILTRN